MNPPERCDTCSGVARGSMMQTMANVAMIRQLLTELERVGVPPDALATVRTWTDQNYKQCTCASDGFAFLG